MTNDFFPLIQNKKPTFYFGMQAFLLLCFRNKLYGIIVLLYAE